MNFSVFEGRTLKYPLSLLATRISLEVKGRARMAIKSYRVSTKDIRILAYSLLLNLLTECPEASYVLRVGLHAGG